VPFGQFGIGFNTINVGADGEFIDDFFVIEVACVSREKKRDVFGDILDACEGIHSYNFLCGIGLGFHFFVRARGRKRAKGGGFDILDTVDSGHSYNFLCKIGI
jgi:hypothetical protein